ncbi:MAG: hypothetical protein U0974_15195 [Gemmatimonadales bacterium]|nr:hypothetical protein [Gemmatimonadales bacterium]MDZ4391066.1 hypothetical protein [Gemmatimonadales bacterium]
MFAAQQFRMSWFLMIVCLCGRVEVTSAQTPEARRDIDLMVGHANASERLLSLRTEGGMLWRTMTTVDSGPRVATGITTWRAVTSTSVYLFVQDRDSLYRTGGFESGDLEVVWRLLGRHQPCASGIVPRVICLATLADPFGAMNLVVPSAPPDDGRAMGKILLEWERARPQDWPVDTVITSGAMNTAVALTVLTQNQGNFEGTWFAIAYSFSFDDENLAAWSRRILRF